MTQDCRLGTEMHCIQSWYLWQIEVVSHFWNTAGARLLDSVAFLFWICCFLELLPVSCFVGLQSYLWPMHVFFLVWHSFMDWQDINKPQVATDQMFFWVSRNILCVCSNIFHYYSCRVFFSDFLRDFMMRQWVFLCYDIFTLVLN